MPPVKKIPIENKSRIKQKVKNKNVLKKHFQYSEENLRQALYAIQEGQMPVRTAAREFGVPKTTLQDHKSGKIPNVSRKTGPQPILTVAGEEKLANWILSLAKCGFPVKKLDLLETVEAIVKNTEKESLFKDGKPGQKWYLNFLKRHPIISLREAESVTKARAIITEESIRAWFRGLRLHLRETQNEEILEDPDRILNGDEAGFSLCPKTGKVLAPRGWKNVYSIKIGNEKDNITVLVTFTASGKICPPLVLFPYVRPPKALVDNMPPNWVLGRSDSGWMKGDVFFEFIANDFNQWITQNSIKRPILLLIDGHKSHMTMQLSEFCDQNGIILYALPPNTTHILQPADVSVFRPLKNEWKKTVRKWQNQPENVNHSVNKINFCKVFQKALNNTNMQDHIKNGFRKCGLYPFEPNNVDYTKCVKNFLEQQNTSTLEVQPGKVTTYEIESAKQVLERIRGKLTNHGIDVDLIMHEMDSLQLTDNVAEIPNLIGAILPMDDFQVVTPTEIILELATDVTPIIEDIHNITSIPTTEENNNQDLNIRIENLPHSVSIDCVAQTNKSYSGGSIAQTGDIPTCSSTNSDSSLNCEKTKANNDNTNYLVSLCSNTPEMDSSNDINNYLPTLKETVLNQNMISKIHNSSDLENESNQSSKDTLPVDNTATSINIQNVYEEEKLCCAKEVSPVLQNIDKNIQYVPLDISFDAVLKYKIPNDIPGSVKNQDKEKAPKAISAQSWRNFQNKKGHEKLEKERNIKRRREERNVAKNEKKKLQIKKKKVSKNVKDSENKPRTSEEKINCAACSEELNSDTEEEDNKNIGCDNCPKWFHLHCTDFIGLNYAEAAAKDYTCFTCS